MHIVSYLSNAERWHWFAAGDGSATTPAIDVASDANAPGRLMFEIGLVLGVPLVAAVVACTVFGG